MSVTGYYISVPHTKLSYGLDYSASASSFEFLINGKKSSVNILLNISFCITQNRPV